MAGNSAGVLTPYFGANDINYWDIIKLSDKYSNVNQNIYESTEDFWDVMPHYMLHLIMSSDSESRTLHDRPRSTSLSNMPGQPIKFNQRNSLIQRDRKEIHTNPMDVFIYVFRKAHPLMRQIIVNQVSKCQLSLPLIIQDPIFHKPLMFPFSYLNLSKSFLTSEGLHRSFHVSEEKLNIISFIRIGKSGKSFKSKLMNKLLGFNHSCFFNRDCRGSSKTRLLYDGTIEMNWYLPGGLNENLFEAPLTFLNLRGNAFEFKKQLTFICEISTMIGIVLTYDIKNDNELQELGKLTTKHSDKICLIFTDEVDDDQEENDIVEFCYQLPNFSPSASNVILSGNIEERAIAIRTGIKQILCQNISPIKLSITDFSKVCKDKELGIIFEDEFVDLRIENCKNRIKAFHDSSLSTAFKKLRPEEYLPLQHEGWKKYAQADRNQRKLRNEKDIFNKARGIYEKKFELTAARNLQLNTIYQNQNYPIALKEFKYIIFNITNPEDVLIMLTILRIELGKLFFPDSKTINIQHFIRELGQYYEMCHDIGEGIALNSIRQHIGIDHKLLPQLFARLMLLGEPLEIFDGEAQHIPLTWVQDVLKSLSNIIGYDKKIFVLGVLGIQSSGKSTLLNTMFGLQFPVATGRCTRGISMQLISVDNHYVLNYDYLVILDSEGLRSMENSNQDLKSRDNEFTTLMIGISDLCIINIMGENFLEWQDIFQTIIIALMKLTSSTTSKPKCLFVHQNISDPNAREALKEGYQKFLLKLDGVTQFISTETKSNPIYTKFTDIVDFDINESIYFLSSLYSTPPPMSVVSKYYVNAVQNLKKIIISKYIHKSCAITFLAWSAKLKTVWKSILKENFVSSYREIIERIYYSEFENALHRWSQNYTCEMEKELLLCKDQILNSNCEVGEKYFQSYESDIVGKCRAILECDEKEFQLYYFETHNARQIFKNWKSQSEQHFKNTRLDYQIRTKEKLSHLFKIAERNHKLFNDFYGKRDEILKKASKTKFKLLYEKTEDKNQELFEQYFENEWQNWISDLNFSQHEIPCVNFILLLMNEFDSLTSNLQLENKDMENIKSFFKRIEETNYSIDVFVIGENHYRMFEQDDREIQIAHKYSSWLNYALREDENVSDTDFPENILLIKKVIDLILRITETCDNYVKEISQELFRNYFIYIIKSTIKCVQEFNNKDKNDKTIEIRVQIGSVFIYELVLFLCAKLLTRFKNKYKPNQMDFLKTQLKSVFKHYYDRENYSSSLACANVLANILLEKMNLYLAEELQFLVINDFSDFSPFSVSSKCHLQTKVLTDLANQSSFDQYWKYIHEPNQAMKDWIIEKFQEFCKYDSAISRINAWYKKSIVIQINTYREALQQALNPPIKEKKTNVNHFISYIIETTLIEHSIINCDWKAQLHKKLEGEHTRQFKLSDLDVLLIEPNEIISPSEFVIFFSDSFQKQCDGYNLTNWIETYLMAEILTTFSDTICQNLFYCNEHCPLCNEPCLSNINSSEHKHYCGSFHRPLGLNGWFKFDSEEFIGYDCTNFNDKDESTFYKHKNYEFELRKQMGESWDNSRKHYMIESVYWEWVMCKFKDELAEHFQYKINDKAIKAWSNLTQSQVLNDLHRQMNDFHSPALMWRTKKKIKHFFSSQNY